MRHGLVFKSFTRGAIGALCAGALVAGQCGVAFAADDSWSYPVPPSATTVDGNLITFGSQGDIWGEILGISDVTRNSNSGDFNSDGTISASGVAKDSVVNLFGSSVNTNPNPYYANLLYNSQASEGDQVSHYQFADKSGLGTGIDRADTTAVDAYGGVSATMSYRPDILMGNCATSWQDPGSIILRSDGKTPVSVSNYALSISAGYDSQVSTIRGLKADSEYRQSGDGSYNPYYVENLSMYGDITDTGDISKSADPDVAGMTAGKATINSTYAQMYRLVTAIDGVKSQNKSKTTRYGDPEKIAAQYESYGKGLQDYVLSKIDDKTITKKKVAVVSDVDPEANTVTLYKSSPKNTIEGTASSFSGPYKHMEALENVTDNIAGTWSTTEDKSSSRWGTSYTTTKVVTDISELKKADDIILCYSSDEANLKTVLENAGISDADTPPILSNYATTTSRSIPGFPMLQTDGVEMSATELGFVYPEVINPVYALAYYYTQFYHVKSDTTTLSNVLSYNIENMSLPKGVTSDLSNYSDSVIEKDVQAGLRYYAKNKSTIDSEHPKLKTTSHVTLPSADKPADNTGLAVGAKATAGSGASKATYQATSANTVSYVASKVSSKATSATVPATVTIKGVKYRVTDVAAKAFKNLKKLTMVTIGGNVNKIQASAFSKTPKLKTLKVSSKSLSKKATVKNSFKGSQVKTLTVKAPSKSYVSKYKKSFAKSNIDVSKKVTVKA